MVLDSQGKTTSLAARRWPSSRGQRCYVNWLLFGKLGRSPSHEQNAPQPPLPRLGSLPRCLPLALMICFNSGGGGE